MTTLSVAELERQIHLLMTLDRDRDAIMSESDPAAMFHAMAAHLKAALDADACAIIVAAEDNTKPEYIATTGMNSITAVDLYEEARNHLKPAPVDAGRWAYTLGLQIKLDRYSASLGAIIIAKNAAPFSEADERLLITAESQIDSAVLQARRIIALANRNRELEGIYRVDTLRDADPDESAIISGLTALLREYYNPDLVMILLRKMDSDEMTLRGILDRSNISADTLRAIRAIAAGVTAPRTIPTPPEIPNVTLACAPLIIGTDRLGEIIIGREKQFNAADMSLLKALVTQTDSAIAHSRTLHDLRQRNRELETVYRIDQIRDTEEDLDAMLQKVLVEICRVIESELGYLMLFSEDSERRLELRATSEGGDALTQPGYLDAIQNTARRALDEGWAIYDNQPQDSVRSIVAIPLELNRKVIGVFGVVNSKNPNGFTMDDRRMLQAITSQVDTAVFERLERRRLRHVLSRSIDSKLIDLLLDRTSGQDVLAGERVVISVLYADLRSSTEWTERTHPETLVSTLNKHLANMTDVIFKHSGTLDKFVGDEVIALFGAPFDMPDHALVAVRCALQMQVAHQALRDELAEQGLELPLLGVGVSTGEAIVGEMGSHYRSDFTAIGRVMNLGSRLCSIAPGGKTLICETTYNAFADQIIAQELTPVTLKGIGEARMFELQGTSE